MFTFGGKNGSVQGQMQDLRREEVPALPTPVWVETLRQEMRAMGDIMRLREALAVAHRDIERFRIERDKILKMLSEERDKSRDLESVIHRMMQERKV